MAASTLITVAPTGAEADKAAVPVLPADTPEALSARILTTEHRLYPLALGLAASGKARLVQGRVVLEASINQAARLLAPDGEA